LPDGRFGGSGAIVDPKAAGNDNNSINRIALNTGVPASFFFHLVVDNTDLLHDSINKIMAKGGHGSGDIDPLTFPRPGVDGFNGIPDVYTFRYDGFQGGDVIKVQFNGEPGSAKHGGAGGASFCGFMFDAAQAAPSPSVTIQ
jgi:hypothetical protein